MHALFVNYYCLVGFNVLIFINVRELFQNGGDPKKVFVKIFKIQNISDTSTLSEI